jgi:hypothetical protein
VPAPRQVVPGREWQFTLTTTSGQQRMWDLAALSQLPVEDIGVSRERGGSTTASADGRWGGFGGSYGRCW